eukprot:NODE_1082_length_1717_cov_42.219424_g958_i0.p1 GENE.NODE_1082_length_1717_cov_42.219424_g958_i0~~NODE_1082_length_1717_cov_42.219424_g958_i0.p1  ORF type:complete len:490 (-),score=53.39 NODE_1082_length_1717_cov_42.219424_g958_i0:246-1538(-)
MAESIVQRVVTLLAIVLLLISLVFGVVACATRRWVVLDSVSENSVALGHIKLLDSDATALLSTLLSNGSSGVSGSQNWGIWETCADFAITYASGPNSTMSSQFQECTNLEWGEGDCAQDMRYGVRATRALLIIAIIVNAAALVCTCAFFAVSSVRVAAIVLAFFSFLLYLITYFIFLGAARQNYCGTTLSRLKCDYECEWGYGFWFVFVCGVCSLMAALLLCLGLAPPEPGMKEEKDEEVGLPEAPSSSSSNSAAGHHEATNFLPRGEEPNDVARHDEPGPSHANEYSRDQEVPMGRHDQTTLHQPNVRPTLGAEIAMIDDRYGNRDCVCQVYSVNQGGPAQLAGVLPEDILVKWNGTPIDSKENFKRLVQAAAIGDRVKLTIYRSSESSGQQWINCLVTLGSRTDGPAETRAVNHVNSTPLFSHDMAPN